MEGFYDFLYGLGYLEPQYALKMEGKELFELSHIATGTGTGLKFAFSGC